MGCKGSKSKKSEPDGQAPFIGAVDGPPRPPGRKMPPPGKRPPGRGPPTERTATQPPTTTLAPSVPPPNEVAEVETKRDDEGSEKGSQHLSKHSSKHSKSKHSKSKHGSDKKSSGKRHNSSSSSEDPQMEFRRPREMSHDVAGSETPDFGNFVGGGGVMNFRQSLREAGDRLVIIKFYEDKCEDCDAMSQLYEEFVAKYPEVLFLEANVKNNSEAVGQLRIKFLPTFIAFKNHLEVGRLVDTKVADIENLIQKNMGK